MLQWKYWKDNIRFLAFYSQNEAFMKFKNFLENLYLGHLDTEVFLLIRLNHKALLR